MAIDSQMSIRLRRTREEDLEYVLCAESAAENRRFVWQWTRAEHMAALTSEDTAHFIIETVADERPVGYVILAGLALPRMSVSVELKRLVVTEKSRGYGRQALRLVQGLVFAERGAHRLWLDVVEHNVRAQALYESEGFVREGTLRECQRGESGYESLIIMSLLEAEYRARTRA